MKITRLPKREFWDRYDSLCKPVEGLSDEEEQKYNKAIDQLDAKLKAALSDYADEEDYQTPYDWNPCWHHCCGVYGKGAFTNDFLKRIFDVLADEESPWCFHLACEPNFDGLGDGQLFIHSGEVFADASAPLDYSVFEEKQLSEQDAGGKRD